MEPQEEPNLTPPGCPCDADADAASQAQASEPEDGLIVGRRVFIAGLAAAGAGLILPPGVRRSYADYEDVPPPKASSKLIATTPAAKPAPKPAPRPAAAPKAAPKPAPKLSDIKVGFIGPGNQGRNLLVHCLGIPGVRFTAVCDIWPYSQDYAKNILKAYNQPVNVYTDYHDMLDKEKDLDAVIIATPDWVHSEQTVACLEAGKHVYCEKEMSNTVEGARKMVEAQRRTKKLLQIGHQRRSNPRYWSGDGLIHKQKALGRVTHVYGQWNRSRRLDLSWPKGRELDKATLDKYGYGSMERFRNWRWFHQYSGGPMADLGSHQVDIFCWFLRTPPTAVQATGGADYYKDREWFDNVMALYEFQTQDGPVRGFYQVLNTTSYGGYYEVFMGDAGSLEISENIAKGAFYPEAEVAPPKAVTDDAKAIEKEGKVGVLLKVGETLGATGKAGGGAKKITVEADKPPHRYHLENFFNAIRNGTPLSCPPEVGFETCVSVLRANDAVTSGQKYTFKSDEFKA